MKSAKTLAWVVAVAASAALPAMAETITVNAPAGTVTNAFAFVSGEDALAVNTGATGGTVRLNPNNTHTGGTTLYLARRVETQNQDCEKMNKARAS